MTLLLTGVWIASLWAQPLLEQEKGSAAVLRISPLDPSPAVLQQIPSVLARRGREGHADSMRDLFWLIAQHRIKEPAVIDQLLGQVLSSCSCSCALSQCVFLSHCLSHCLFRILSLFPYLTAFFLTSLLYGHNRHS